jgi:hypothetical protein
MPKARDAASPDILYEKMRQHGMDPDAKVDFSL